MEMAGSPGSSSTFLSPFNSFTKPTYWLSTHTPDSLSDFITPLKSTWPITLLATGFWFWFCAGEGQGQDSTASKMKPDAARDRRRREPIINNLLAELFKNSTTSSMAD